ncbi:MAG: indole-3-glycerol phosphate synthase TrpC [Ignavibacteriales bacterium]|nr:indole-3-glycerol phosphate synthase TrpC [Ignavibacteriales bacterium]
MSNILSKILAVKKEEVAELRKNFTRESFRDSGLFAKKRLSLYTALSKKEKINVIAEIKKASPSKGILKEDFDHLATAQTYFENGADAVSVLTDRKFFQGHISFLNDIAKRKTVPLLRKDFIIDEFQIFEAKANGADAILLIAEALSKQQIDELSNIAFENDLEVLLEIHSENQLDKIDFQLSKIIGINNRNLETFEVDLATTKNLMKYFPLEIVVVSESGINVRGDVEEMKRANVQALLVGEHFMRSGDIGKSLKEFNEWCKR